MADFETGPPRSERPSASGADQEAERPEPGDGPERTPPASGTDSGSRPAFRYRVPEAPATGLSGPSATEEAASASADGNAASRRGEPIVAVDAADSEGGGRSDPDDPDNLAGWVGSLAGAVEQGDVIAGRQTGPVPVPSDEEASAPEPDWEPSAADAEEEEEEEYQPSRREIWQPMPATTRAELISRLDALAVLVELGRDHFEPELVERARGLLQHAGTRLRLSADHTVIALAGGTGSGKSSLFNALCGLELSRVGITRPTTASAHACVWGVEGADNLLGWLGVPPRYRHARVSELDRDDSDLTGLILLDLPDHDSVRAAQTAESDHLIRTADLLVWVLDPQKYADAAVHHRYLAEMAGHGAVTVAVLNQIDRIGSEEVEELLTDLRRLLETESGVQPRVLTTSVVTGEGMRELRQLLVETVAERRAAIDRLVADLERVVGDFESYGVAGDTAELPPPARAALVDRLAEASGVEAIAETVESVHERRGARAVGWPLLRWARRLRRDPLRAAQLEFLTSDDVQASAGPVGAQRAEIDTAIVAVADAAADSLPAPWPRRVREAGRTNLETLPDELGAAIAGTVPDESVSPSWWQVARIAQYLLTVLAGGGLVWFGVLLVGWIGGGLTEPGLLVLAAALTAGALLLGWLTGVGCRNLVTVEAARRRERVEMYGAEQVRRIAVERVVAPMEAELNNYERYCQALHEVRPADRG